MHFIFSKHSKNIYLLIRNSPFHPQFTTFKNYSRVQLGNNYDMKIYIEHQ